MIIFVAVMPDMWVLLPYQVRVWEDLWRAGSPRAGSWWALVGSGSRRTGGKIVTDVLAAVLVDMDGVLVDTEPLWLETETAVMARLGARWTAGDQEALLGGSMARTVSYLLAKATR